MTADYGATKKPGGKPVSSWRAPRRAGCFPPVGDAKPAFRRRQLNADSSRNAACRAGTYPTMPAAAAAFHYFLRTSPFWGGGEARGVEGGAGAGRQRPTSAGGAESRPPAGGLEEVPSPGAWDRRLGGRGAARAGTEAEDVDGACFLFALSSFCGAYAPVDIQQPFPVGRCALLHTWSRVVNKPEKQVWWWRRRRLLWCYRGEQNEPP